MNPNIWQLSFNHIYVFSNSLKKSNIKLNKIKKCILHTGKYSTFIFLSQFWVCSEHENMPKIITSPTKCEVRWYRELTLKSRETNHSTQKLWTSDFLESPDPITKQDHQLTLNSFPDHLHHEYLYILLQSSCTVAALCCHSWKFPHTHYSFVEEFWLQCTPPHKESNYSTHFTFGGRLYCFRHVYLLSMLSELRSAMRCDRRAY